MAESIDPLEYEKTVRLLLEEHVRQSWPGASLQIFHNRRYRGRSGHEHQIDVAGEPLLAGCRVLILVECKRYSERVKIEDVLTLAGRVDDVGAHKGIVVTKVGYQDGAKKAADSKGIALVLVPPDGNSWTVVLPSLLPLFLGFPVRHPGEKRVPTLNADTLLSVLAEIGRAQKADPDFKSFRERVRSSVRPDAVGEIARHLATGANASPERHGLVMLLVGFHHQHRGISDLELFAPILDLLQDAEDDVRAYGAYTLGVACNEESVPFLVLATQDRAPMVTALAAWSLSHLRGAVPLSMFFET